MSRIAGIAGPSLSQVLVDEMLRASQSVPNWRRLVHSEEDQATLGWCGWTEPQVARDDGVLVALDGCLYDRAGFEPTASLCLLLAKLYRRHGFAGMLERINGDFAIALYDPKVRTLWLARDRFGLRPLYYTVRSCSLAFASRLRALLTLPEVSSRPRRQYVALYAASHYRAIDHDPGKSPYEDIAQLPAGHFLRWEDDRLICAPYWRIEEAPDLDGTEEELSERYRDLLLDAVSLRLKAARKPAFTLSGGMDSSSVLACAVQALGTKQPALSTVYEDKTYDESSEIRSMLDTQVSDWHQVLVGEPDISSLVSRLVEEHDEPVATATWLSHYLLCRRARDLGFESLFGGLGGDEFNAGEYECFPFFFADLRAAGREDTLRREVECWIAHHDHPVFRKSPIIMEDALKRLVDLGDPGRCLPDHKRLRRYAAALNPDYFRLEKFEPVMESPFKSYLKNRAYHDLSRETTPCCLRAEDRQTTALGLGNFLPFLDHRVVEFTFRVPATMKIRNGITKHLLRLAMRGLLPEETRTRIKKTGWNAPAHVWFSSKAGRELLLDIAHSRAFRERGVYNVKEVVRLIDEHQAIVSSGRSEDNHMMFFWQLVNLELWLRRAEGRTSS